MERKTEFILTLIGAIINALFSGLMILITGLMGIGMATMNNYTVGDDYYYDSYNYSDSFIDNDTWIGFSFLIALCIVLVIFSVLGFIAAFKVKKDSQGWGIAVLVIGILSIASLQGILWLIAGIMMVSRKSSLKSSLTSTSEGTSSTLLSDMEQLKELRDQGIISEDEYQAKRNEWMDF